MPKFVICLNSPEAETTVPAVGGKGANLAAMLRAGFPVPPGFVITTDAFRAFMEANDLPGALQARRWERLLDAPVSPVIPETTVQQIFVHGSIPKEIEHEILREYCRLSQRAWASDLTVHRKAKSSNSDSGQLPIAVRSSATTEDIAPVSFAGGQETYLNVRGEAALLEAVLRIWASLWSLRAIDYLLRRGINPANIGLAVLVQKMVLADSSGVVFTINPLTGNRDEAVINAAWGLGEAVVRGQVTPDCVIVEKATHRVKNVVIGDKKRMTVMTREGTRDVAVELRRRAESVLSREQIKALIDVGRGIESHFGYPQDIEWAFVNKRLHILQARPVTSRAFDAIDQAGRSPYILGDDNWPVAGEVPPWDFDLWTQANVGEIWPSPVTPLMWSAVPFILGTATRYALRGLKAEYVNEIQWVKRLYGRVYYNEGALSYLFFQELGLPASFVDRALGSRRRPLLWRDKRFCPKRFLRRLPFLLRVIFCQLRSGKQLEDLIPQVDDWVSHFVKRSLHELSDRELWRERNMWETRFIHVMKVNTELNNYSFTAFGLLELLAALWCGRKDLAHDLVTGLSGIHSAEMGIELWQIAQLLSTAELAKFVLDNEPKVAFAKLLQIPEAQPVMRMLDSFLRRHGHHCPNEGEWLYPRWFDAPEQILGIVAGYLRAGAVLDPSKCEIQRRRREEAVSSVRTQLDPARWAAFRLILVRTQHLVRLRENGKNCYMKALYPLRRIYALFGDRWARRRWLRQADDIFFLTIPEVERIFESEDLAASGLDVSTVVKERRKAFEYWSIVEPPDVIGSNCQPVVVESTREPFGRVLQGIPVSSGRVQGCARIIHAPHEAHKLRPGDILVTRATDPGWTPLFPLVSGLVVEIGGQLSHASIVAREYCLPAVANVPNVTHRLRDGQRITLDGTTGHIYLDGGLHSA